MHHPSITFYDELGVSRNATPEEIRDAFRLLVRIVHPDHQMDENLKEIAERQMRKLNRVYAVLSDPEKRRRYNDSLDGETVTPTIILSPDAGLNARRVLERIAWVLALAALIGTLIWMSADNPALTQSSQSSDRPARKNPGATAPAATSAYSPATPQEIEQLRSDLRLMTMERDAAIHQVIRLRAMASKSSPNWNPPEPVSSPAAPLPAMTSLPSQPLPAQTAPRPLAAAPPYLAPTKPTSSPGRAFTGFWFYTKPAQREKNSSLYPPEFIEATIFEQNGVLRGKYRSRYKIVDRAISPDVSFEFSGISSGATLNCPWNGPGGAKGELNLRIVGENSLKIDWVASELGSIQGLVTGTATLTRKID